MKKIGEKILISFLLLSVVFILWIAWIAPEKDQDKLIQNPVAKTHDSTRIGNAGQTETDKNSQQPNKAITSEVKTKDDFNPAGYWRYRFYNDASWSYRIFSEDGQYKWYVVKEPEAYDGKWEWINGDQINLTSYPKKGDKPHSLILTIVKNGNGQYIMKEDSNGNPIEWERFVTTD